MWAFSRRESSGESLAKEAAVLIAKWEARGLAQAALEAIRGDVFNIATREAGGQVAGVLVHVPTSTGASREPCSRFWFLQRLSQATECSHCGVPSLLVDCQRPLGRLLVSPEEREEHLDHAVVAEFHIFPAVRRPQLAEVLAPTFDQATELALVLLLGFGLIPRGVFPRQSVQQTYVVVQVLLYVLVAGIHGLPRRAFRYSSISHVGQLLRSRGNSLLKCP